LAEKKRKLALSPLAVEKLLFRDFDRKICLQVVEFWSGRIAEIPGNYCFGSFFNSHACPFGPIARETT